MTTIDAFVKMTRQGQVAEMERILDLNPTLLNQANRVDWTALHCASHYSQIAVIELLLRRGARVNSVHNSVNMYNMTPLHFACGNRKEAAARLLIEAGADVHITNRVSN